MGRPQTLPGRTIGRLKIVSLSHYVGNNAQYLCECSCGQTTIVSGSNLYKKARVQSCGCLRTEMRATGNLRRLSNREFAINNLSSKYRGSARARNYSWCLSKELVEQLLFSPCHYCGVVEDNSFTFPGYDPVPYNGIDRIDNSRGYEPDNVVACCGTCNKAKGTMPYADFIAWCDRISGHSLARKFLIRT